MTDRNEWMTMGQTATALSITPATANSRAMKGRLAGSVKNDAGGWMVRRSEVARILAEREQAVEQRLARLARWQPMTDRTTVNPFSRPDGDDEGQHA